MNIPSAIRQCAVDIIRNEAICLEWGVEADRSVELAEEKITELVNKILSEPAKSIPDLRLFV